MTPEEFLISIRTRRRNLARKLRKVKDVELDDNTWRKNFTHFLQAETEEAFGWDSGKITRRKSPEIKKRKLARQIKSEEDKLNRLKPAQDMFKLMVAAKDDLEKLHKDFQKARYLGDYPKAYKLAGKIQHVNIWHKLIEDRFNVNLAEFKKKPKKKKRQLNGYDKALKAWKRIRDAHKVGPYFGVETHAKPHWQDDPENTLRDPMEFMFSPRLGEILDENDDLLIEKQTIRDNFTKIQSHEKRYDIMPKRGNPSTQDDQFGTFAFKDALDPKLALPSTMKFDWTTFSLSGFLPITERTDLEMCADRTREAILAQWDRVTFVQLQWYGQEYAKLIDNIQHPYHAALASSLINNHQNPKRAQPFTHWINAAQGVDQTDLTKAQYERFRRIFIQYDLEALLPTPSPTLTSFYYKPLVYPGPVGAPIRYDGEGKVIDTRIPAAPMRSPVINSDGTYANDYIQYLRIVTYLEKVWRCKFGREMIQNFVPVPKRDSNGQIMTEGGEIIYQMKQSDSIKYRNTNWHGKKLITAGTLKFLPVPRCSNPLNPANAATKRLIAPDFVKPVNNGLTPTQAHNLLSLGSWLKEGEQRFGQIVNFDLKGMIGATQTGRALLDQSKSNQELAKMVQNGQELTPDLLSKLLPTKDPLTGLPITYSNGGGDKNDTSFKDMGIQDALIGQKSKKFRNNRDKIQVVIEYKPPLVLNPDRFDWQNVGKQMIIMTDPSGAYGRPEFGAKGNGLLKERREHKKNKSKQTGQNYQKSAFHKSFSSLFPDQASSEYRTALPMDFHVVLRQSHPDGPLEPPGIFEKQKRWVPGVPVDLQLATFDLHFHITDRFTRKGAILDEMKKLVVDRVHDDAQLGRKTNFDALINSTAGSDMEQQQHSGPIIPLFSRNHDDGHFESIFGREDDLTTGTDTNTSTTTSGWTTTTSGKTTTSTTSTTSSTTSSSTTTTSAPSQKSISAHPSSDPLDITGYTAEFPPQFGQKWYNKDKPFQSGQQNIKYGATYKTTLDPTTDTDTDTDYTDSPKPKQTLRSRFEELERSKEQKQQQQQQKQKQPNSTNTTTISITSHLPPNQNTNFPYYSKLIKTSYTENDITTTDDDDDYHSHNNNQTTSTTPSLFRPMPKSGNKSDGDYDESIYQRPKTKLVRPAANGDKITSISDRFSRLQAQRIGSKFGNDTDSDDGYGPSGSVSENGKKNRAGVGSGSTTTTTGSTTSRFSTTSNLSTTTSTSTASSGAMADRIQSIRARMGTQGKDQPYHSGSGISRWSSHASTLGKQGRGLLSDDGTMERGREYTPVSIARPKTTSREEIPISSASRRALRELERRGEDISAFTTTTYNSSTTSRTSNDNNDEDDTESWDEDDEEETDGSGWWPW